MEITNEQLLQLLQEKLEQRPAKSMLKMEISDFTADAYKQGEFIKVSKKDLLGKWSVLFFYPADFTFVCPTELEDLQNKYPEFLKAGCEERKNLPYHKMLLNGELPYTIGGGIGQSRLCMLLLDRAHVGEVQASLWPEEMRVACREHNIILL